MATVGSSQETPRDKRPDSPLVDKKNIMKIPLQTSRGIIVSLPTPSSDKKCLKNGLPISGQHLARANFGLTLKRGLFKHDLDSTQSRGGADQIMLLGI